MFIDAADHLAVDKGAGRGVAQVEPDAALLLDHPDIEILIPFEQFPAVIEVTAVVEHGQRAVAKERIEIALTGVEEFAHFQSGEDIQAAVGVDARVNDIVLHEKSCCGHEMIVKMGRAAGGFRLTGA
jgi:hypothetical protein